MNPIQEKNKKRLMDFHIKNLSKKYYSSDEYLRSLNKSFTHECLIGDLYACFGLKYNCLAKTRRNRIFCKLHGKYLIFEERTILTNFMRDGCYLKFGSLELCEYPCQKHRCLSRIYLGNEEQKYFIQCEKSIYNNLLVCEDHLCDVCGKEYNERFLPSIYTTILCFREMGKIDKNLIKFVLSFCYPKIITKRLSPFDKNKKARKAHFYFEFDRYAKNLMNCAIYCNCPNGKKLCSNFSKSQPPNTCCRYTINNEEFCENCKLQLMIAEQKIKLEKNLLGQVDLFLSKEGLKNEIIFYNPKTKI